ncbi:hypothetical protein RFI_04797, partial [Reticulomyxa filosa]
MVKKHNSEEITKQMHQMIKWLQSKHVEVFIEPSSQEEFQDLPVILPIILTFSPPPPLPSKKKKTQPTKKKVYIDIKQYSFYDPGEGIDFMICLGGDGTLLHLTNLFQAPKTVPPVIVFASGSLGFLTPYEFSYFPKYLGQLLKPNIPHFVTFRLRLEAKIYRFNANASKSEIEIPKNVKKNSNS